ncbi:hypothetical protein ACHAWF_002022 [Thalassiosira exigua]
MDDALAAIDHVAARVTASVATGLGCGAVYATLRGFPVFKTSMSVALSCALVSTACFGMERIAYGALNQSALLMDEKYTHEEEIISMKQSTRTSPKLIYGSHALGGLFGGSVVGFLFRGKPLAGAFLLTPLMLGVGTFELYLNDYRAGRLQQLERMHQLLESREDDEPKNT